MKNSHQLHLRVAKRILRSIGGTRSDKIFYSENDPIELFGYTDGDWADDTIERKEYIKLCIFHWLKSVFLEFKK